MTSTYVLLYGPADGETGPTYARMGDRLLRRGGGGIDTEYVLDPTTKNAKELRYVPAAFLAKTEGPGDIEG